MRLVYAILKVSTNLRYDDLLYQIAALSYAAGMLELNNPSDVKHETPIQKVEKE